jgi:hypothetical protein
MFLSVPVFSAAANGTVSLLLLLGLAAAWRYRETVWRLGALVAALIALKLFLWPLWLWMALSRRIRAAAASIVAGALMTLGGWALIGFAGVGDYPKLLGRMTQLVGTNSYSLYALERAAGASHTGAQAGIGAVALALAAAVWGGRIRGDVLFVVAIGAALLLTPILWPHYLVLLFVPIALARRRFSALWLLPLAYWLDGATWSYAEPIRIVPALLVGVAIVVTSARMIRSGDRLGVSTKPVSRRRSLRQASWSMGDTATMKRLLPPRWLACVLIAAPIPTPIGFGPRYRLAPGPPAPTRFACSPAPEHRDRAHVELFANRRVVLVPKGIGVGNGCSYPLRTTQPTGVVEFVPAARPTLGDLFDVWGQPLSRRGFAGFHGAVSAWVDGKRWPGDVRSIPLGRHAQIVLEVGGYVPPHTFFLFPPGT